MKNNKPKSSIIYSGPSLIDGKPIIVVAIVSSKNSKTGNMIQTHIIRSDISPMEASKSGEDYSICGDCKHRGNPTDNPLKKTAENRSCYVALYQGPTVVYKAFQAGKYPMADNAQSRVSIGAGRMLRLGSYGDPAAVPSYVWQELISKAQGHTGYSHQASVKGAEYEPSLMMYSADTLPDAQLAWSQGIRTFRVIPLKQYTDQGKASIASNEILCPASKETGAKVQCQACKLCSGNSIKAKSIAIVDHGPQRKKAVSVSKKAVSVSKKAVSVSKKPTLLVSVSKKA